MTIRVQMQKRPRIVARGTLGLRGYAAWTPVYAVEVDGDRRVLRVADYIDGEGEKPPFIGWYVGAIGLTQEITEGADIRGDMAWTPVLALVTDGDRVVHRIIDWIGGTGPKPATGYVTDIGLSDDIGNGVDLRGYRGWSPVFGIVADNNRRIYQLTDWTGGVGPKPSVLSGTGETLFVAEAGFTTDPAQAIDVRGPQGIQGVQGVPGGGMTARYSYSSTITNEDPGTGFLRGNNATFASSTQLYVSNTNGSGAAFGAAIDTFDDSTSTSLRGHVQLTSESDPSKFVIFAVTGAVTANTGYKTIAVTPVASNGTFGNDEALVLSFVRTGNLGATGAQGAHGGLTARYIFSTTTTDADPGVGFLRLSGAVNAATVLRASNTALNGVAFGPIMDTFDDSTSAVKGFIRLQHETDLTKWALYSVTAVASPTGYKNISIAHVGSGTAFANNDPVVLSFMRTGDQGVQGIQGAHGGAVTLRYTVSTVTTDADPGNGFLRFNNATMNAASQIFIDHLDQSGASVQNLLSTFDDSTNSVKGQIRIVHATDPTKYLIFNIISNVIAATDYSKLVLTNVSFSAASPFANNDPVVVCFTRAGDKGAAGDQGWSPVYAVVSDGERRVLQVSDWTGGAGTKPATGSYLGPTGFVASIGAAVDIRGAQGAQGLQGEKGWSPVFSIVSDGARRVLQVTDWVGGAGAKPATGSYVGTTGLVAGIAQAVDIRGPAGPAVGANSVDNTLLADMATGTIKGRVSAGTGDPEDLTGAQAAGIMPVVRYDAVQVLTEAQKQQARDNTGLIWRPLHRITLGADVAAIDISIPAAARMIRITGALQWTVGTSAALGMRFSFDNGATYKAGATDYKFGVLYGSGSATPAHTSLSADRIQLTTTALGGNVPPVLEALIANWSANRLIGVSGSGGLTDGNGDIWNYKFAGYYPATAALTNVRLFATSGNLKSSSELIVEYLA